MLPRILLLIIFSASQYWCLAQFQTKNFYLSPIIGARIHNDRHEELSRGGPPQTLVTSVFGMELSLKKIPFSISYQRDYNQSFWHYIGDEYFLEGHVREIWEEDQIDVYWRLRYFSLGLGHYWKKRENDLNHSAPGFFVLKRRGFQITVSYPTHWLDIEVRTKLQYDPDFAGLVGLNNYSLLFYYRIGKHKKVSKELGFLTINGIIGMRSFIPDIDLLPGEEFNKPIAFAPSLGLEFLIDQINISVNIDKDWWLSFNGGSTRRDVRGLIYSSFIGAKYHFLLKNKHHLRLGMGASWIEDNENKFENITPHPTPTQQKLGNFQVKGIGVTVSYEILPNTDIELKTTLPTIGEKIFENRSRTSLGLFYRFNPLREKGK